MSNSDEDVGYKKPPKKHRFQKGKSGNVKGRPKKIPNFSDLFIEVLQEKITCSENGKTLTLTKEKAIIRQIIKEALHGNLKAIPIVLKEIKTAEIRGAKKEPLSLSFGKNISLEEASQAYHDMIRDINARARAERSF